MKRVTIWGTTLKKVADEAQMISQYKIVKTFAPDADVTMLTYLKPLVQKSYPNLTITPIPKIHKSLPRIFKSDLFVVGGGPFFDHTPHLIRVAILMFFIWIARVPLLIYGVTGFPVKSWLGRTVFKWMGNYAQEIVTRDAGAYKSLTSVGIKTPIRQGIDLRAVLDPAPRERVEEILKEEGLDPKKPMVAFTVRYIHKDVPDWVKEHLDMHDNSVDKFNEALGKVAAELSKTAQVFVIAMNPDPAEDKAVAEKMREYMDDPSQLKLIEHRFLATETLGILKACDMIVAGRVGSAFFATMLETPFIAIAHEGRMKDWMEEIGMQQYMFDWQSLDAEKILNQVDTLNKSRTEIVKAFKVKAESSRKQAWQDAEIYKEFLLN
ncbi:MAG TPA: hypothetical protein DCX53_09315 [Anaerolineae bacterium]|nr:hypothetical protein [Anaerolineae bacterium]